MYKTTFNAWILSKILNFLKNREGMDYSNTEYTLDGIKTTVTDAFGYRYEIHVKIIGRLQNGIRNEENPYMVDAALQKDIKTHNIT